MKNDAGELAQKIQADYKDISLLEKALEEQSSSSIKQSLTLQGKAKLNTSGKEKINLVNFIY